MRTHLYLITPVITDPAAFRPQLAAALAAAKISVVLMRFASTDETDIKRQVKAFSALVQDAGAALLIEGGGDARLAARAGADGVHMVGLGGLPDALESLRPDRTVGVSGLKTRDDCMEAGELDVDYLMFGEPKPDGYVPPLEQTVERCQWWAELFQIPCVGYAQTIADVAAIAATGAEFVALGDALWGHQQGIEAAMADVAKRLAEGSALSPRA